MEFIRQLAKSMTEPETMITAPPNVDDETATVDEHGVKVKEEPTATGAESAVVGGVDDSSTTILAPGENALVEPAVFEETTAGGGTNDNHEETVIDPTSSKRKFDEEGGFPPAGDEESSSKKLKTDEELMTESSLKEAADAAEQQQNNDEDTKIAAVDESLPTVKKEEGQQGGGGAGEQGDGGPPPVPAGKEGISIFGDNDVLSGRGGGTNVHPGNRNFRDLINLHRRSYLKARKNDKPAISRAIVRAVRESNGRFLRKDEKSGLWFEIGDDAAREKTSQALRQRAPEMRKLLFDTEREEARVAVHEQMRQQRILMGMHPDMMPPGGVPMGMPMHPGGPPMMMNPAMFMASAKNGMPPMPPGMPPPGAPTPEAYQQMMAAAGYGPINRYPGAPPGPMAPTNIPPPQQHLQQQQRQLQAPPTPQQPQEPSQTPTATPQELPTASEAQVPPPSVGATGGGGDDLGQGLMGHPVQDGTGNTDVPMVKTEMASPMNDAVV